MADDQWDKKITYPKRYKKLKSTAAERAVRRWDAEHKKIKESSVVADKDLSQTQRAANKFFDNLHRENMSELKSRANPDRDLAKHLPGRGGQSVFGTRVTNTEGGPLDLGREHAKLYRKMYILRNRANKWAAQEKAAIDSGAKKMPVSSQEKHVNFQDLGEKPGGEIQGRLGQKARGERARAIKKSIKEGRSSIKGSHGDLVNRGIKPLPGGFFKSTTTAEKWPGASKIDSRKASRMTDAPGPLTGILKNTPKQSVDPIRVGVRAMKSAGQPGSNYSAEGGRMLREGLTQRLRPAPIPAGTAKPKAPKMTLRQRLKGKFGGGGKQGGGSAAAPDMTPRTERKDYDDLHEQMRKINDPIK